MAKILVLNGPNLNLLGDREPGHYGVDTLDSINQTLSNFAKSQGCEGGKGSKGGENCESYEIDTLQSNAEHELVDRVHQARSDGTAFIIINPAAFTHTSVALRDAFSAIKIPFIEVHLSNVHARESFRHHSYFSDIAVGVICGLGAQGYELALSAAIKFLNTRNKS